MRGREGGGSYFLTQEENNMVIERKTSKKVSKKERKDLIMGESSMLSLPGNNLVKDLICNCINKRLMAGTIKLPIKVETKSLRVRAIIMAIE